MTSAGKSTSSTAVEKVSEAKTESAAVQEDDYDDEDEELADGDLAAISAGLLEPCKLVRCCAFPSIVFITITRSLLSARIWV